MRLLALVLICAGLLSGAALADPLDGRAARKMLFSERGSAVMINAAAGLSAKDQSTLNTMVSQNGLKYYGAIAFSPDEGLLSEALQGAFSFHGAAPAEAAALAACNRARKKGTAKCLVAATVLPRKWKPRPLQLSVDATMAFKAYRKGGGPKAMAISASSGAFAVGRGEGAGTRALADCKAMGADDCQIVIAD